VSGGANVALIPLQSTDGKSSAPDANVDWGKMILLGLGFHVGAADSRTSQDLDHDNPNPDGKPDTAIRSKPGR
jgi:hypothetical protein